MFSLNIKIQSWKDQYEHTLLKEEFSFPIKMFYQNDFILNLLIEANKSIFMI